MAPFLSVALRVGTMAFFGMNSVSFKGILAVTPAILVEPKEAVNPPAFQYTVPRTQAEKSPPAPRGERLPSPGGRGGTFLSVYGVLGPGVTTRRRPCPRPAPPR